MYKKTLTLLGLSIAVVMSMGSSCSNVGEGLGRVGVGGFGIGGKDADKYETGAKVLGKGAQLAGSYDTGEEELTGQTVACSLFASPGVVDNAKLNDYVTKVGLTIVAVTGRDDIDFSFGILSDDNVNAISAPRGYVFITKGAIAQMKDESELAGVLAHEIAHVVKNHGMEAIRNDKKFDIGASLVTGSTNNTWVHVAANLGTKFKGVIYNQPQENEADKLAVQYLKAAGYDPTALERFLTRNGANTKEPPFSSHPQVKDRLALLHTESGDATGQKLAERFALSVK